MSDLDIDTWTLRACELKTICPEATVDECLHVAFLEACVDDEADVCACEQCQLPAPTRMVQS